MSESDFIPDYLKPFIAHQDASLYTPIDHASWRFILRVSRHYFGTNAHAKYLNGLAETGVSTERIPLVSEMDAKLKRFGWRAVAVSGFIPPAVFMEFQSLGILPIACEMRTLEHLAYTPAPDIVHEAAGHAPIIADPEYSAYLRAYGEISRRAIFSYQDMAVYEAVRNLSIVKEDPRSTSNDVDGAQKRLDEAGAAINFLSEATLMARMNWWTVEYGLVGSLDDPKIYGAGLLSSLGESYHCLGPNIARHPLTLNCIETAYDITKPQPQLFVTPDFAHLTKVLHEFAATMAFSLGGRIGLERAIQAKTVCTAVLDSGVQISGIIDAEKDFADVVSYLHTTGPTQLSFEDIELENQGPEYHGEGFSTVIGKLKDSDKSPADLSDADLAALTKNGMTTLTFHSGTILTGKLGTPVRKKGKTLVLPFSDCTVKAVTGETLFDPAWGTFDLACGEKVVSVFGGAADRRNYLTNTGGIAQLPMNPKSNLTPENRELNTLYAELRKLREEKIHGEKLSTALVMLEKKLEEKHGSDWLLRIEILELALDPALKPELSSEFTARIRDRLHEIAKLSRENFEMIERGLRILPKVHGEKK